MRTDKFLNPIFNEADIFDALYSGHQSVLSQIVADDSYEISQLSKISETIIPKIDESIYLLSINEYDTINQTKWFMPTEYYNFDVHQYVLSKCNTDDEINRVLEELEEFKNRNLTMLLQWLKYFVDTCLSHNIVWGVGRGSSVSSYVLYLLEVHRINSIKYNLDWHDFLR
jgi:DNA polymerase III alpha subunit